MPVHTPDDMTQNDAELSVSGIPATGYTATDSLRVRCPSCRKLYMVQFSDIKEARPRFECVQCHSRFWLSLPDMDLGNELAGIPMQVKETPSSPRPVMAKGIVAPTHSSGLAIAWQKVVADFADDRAHDDFIRTAMRERNLAFAGFQYGQMLKLMPSDETTRKRVGEIQALGGQLMPPRPEERPPRMFSRRLLQLPLALASVMIVMGLLIPFFRNLVGVGAALLFLAIALQWQFRRS